MDGSWSILSRGPEVRISRAWSKRQNVANEYYPVALIGRVAFTLSFPALPSSSPPFHSPPAYLINHSTPPSITSSPLSNTPTHQIQRRQVRRRRQRLRQRTRSLRPDFFEKLPSPRPWCEQPSPYLPPSSPLAALLTLTHTPRSARRPSSSPLSFSTLGYETQACQ
jgi:hypothetical protein